MPVLKPTNLLYRILYFPARIALRFYCRQLRVNRAEYLEIKGPALLAANHPNSFLDAIILASTFKQPIYALARGDAFVSSFVNKLLISLNMLPVYRISEGAENLHHNYDTFEKVNKLLSEDKIVLIFSEGLCRNKWHLRPLKKGTARIAFSAWQDGFNVDVIPVGINYSSFHRFGKSIVVNFGEPICASHFNHKSSGAEIRKFTALLNRELSELVYEIDQDDLQQRKAIFELPTTLHKKVLLFLPATVGYILHAPLYFSASALIAKRANVHYDSIMVGIFFLFYPLYILLITLLAYLTTGSIYALALSGILPITAIALLHYRMVVR